MIGERKLGEIMEMFNNVYKDKVVLVTGHTGFKGSWLSIWLNELGAKVIGYSLDTRTSKDNFELSDLSNKIVDIRGDVRDREKLEQVFQEYNPEYVFHLAAQPLVRESYEKPVYTYEVNVMGTINVLECIRNSKNTKVGIFITTDKCYENKEQVWGYKEIDALGGYDPYSSSKAACELLINSWKQSFLNPNNYAEHGKTLASVRAGNVVGGGDWAKDRIIPDCIRAIEDNQEIEIRSPKAIRPWQHVLEPLRGYLLLGQKLTEDPIKYSGAWNFGPNIDSIETVWKVAEKVIKYYGKGQCRDISNEKHLHEANMLNLDISKAKFKLRWTPALNIDETIKMTVEWYKNYMNCDVYKLCVEQINLYMHKLNMLSENRNISI